MNTYLAVAVAVVLSLADGPASLSRARTQQSTFSAKSELVVLHVLVRDRRGAYVGGLQQRAFSVYEERQPRPIKFFLNEDAPVTIGLLIDSSGSMAPVRDRVIAASGAFIESSNSLSCTRGRSAASSRAFRRSLRQSSRRRTSAGRSASTG